MRFIGGLIGLFALLIGGAAVAAANRKQQIVPIDDEDADEVALVAIFSPVAFHSTATAFRGGTLDCWFGGGIIDLRDATLDPGGATLDVKGVFGGANIVVPRDWRVEVDVTGIGGARDVRPERESAVTAPLLTVTGFVAFGGLGVSSDVPREALEEVTKAMEARRKKSDSEAAVAIDAAAASDGATSPAATEAPAQG
jgi:hypothetical protein